ncbi:MAG: peptidase M15A [Parcubacteria group bacterium Athens0416_74]|nr:MAG: peptidase M15A [Parcubacteria group bacterium Athens0416_74]
MFYMRNLFRALALLVVLTSFPAVSSAATAAELAAQAEVLLQQIAALQAQLAAQTGGTASPSSVVASSNCPLIGRVLKLGSSGDDVTRLQRFLAVDPSIYPEAMITGYYGSLTEAAVKRWQTKYNIVSSGDAESTGFGVTGPRTAAAISLQCSGGSTGGVVGNVTSPTVGGFIQVTPVTGNAPLTVSVVATVNTVNACQAVTYTLDWGDGTVPQNIPVPAGNCAQLQHTYSHIYLYGGTYLVRLSAGQHSTSATVTVSGAAGPVSIVTPSSPSLPAAISISAPTAGQTIQRGVATNISWSASGNIPANSQVSIDLYTSAGQKVGNTITATANMVGTHSWVVPTSVTGGQYKIRATVLAVGAQTVVSAESGVFTITEPFSYGPLAVTPGVSNSPLTIGVSFNIPSSCTGYTLSWGDGTTSATQAHSTSCAQTPITRIFTHEFAAAGSYTITLRRGSDLSQIDTASVVISN